MVAAPIDSTIMKAQLPSVVVIWFALMERKLVGREREHLADGRLSGFEVHRKRILAVVYHEEHQARKDLSLIHILYVIVVAGNHNEENSVVLSNDAILAYLDVMDSFALLNPISCLLYTSLHAYSFLNKKVREAVYHSGKCQSVLLLLKRPVACSTRCV